MGVTKEQKDSFIKTIAPIAIKVCNERGYGDAQAYTCIAQACCESNYGTSTLMRNANAFFGIKANPDWVKAAKYGGLVFNTKTKECYDGKTLTSITDKFRAYRSMDDSVRDYFDLMGTKRYKSSLDATTVLECITIIKKSGYATAPNYINTIMNFYKSSESLINQYHVNGSNKPKTRPTLMMGSSGPDVQYLHKKLKEAGYCYADENSSKFDDLTKMYVEAYQADHDLSVDGIVGPKTWAKIG